MVVFMGSRTDVPCETKGINSIRKKKKIKTMGTMVVRTPVNRWVSNVDNICRKVQDIYLASCVWIGLRVM